MKSWVDTLVARDNVWLVLTFHGVDGIGWEAKPHQELKEYFSYMKEHEENLWIAPFRDVTKYMREKMAGRVNATRRGDEIVVHLEHSLDKDLYNYPLTVKTYVPDDWTQVSIRVDDATEKSENNIPVVRTESDEKGKFVIYPIVPHSSVILTGS